MGKCKQHVPKYCKLSRRPFRGYAWKTVVSLYSGLRFRQSNYTRKHKVSVSPCSDEFLQCLACAHKLFEATLERKGGDRIARWRHARAHVIITSIIIIMIISSSSSSSTTTTIIIIIIIVPATISAHIHAFVYSFVHADDTTEDRASATSGYRKVSLYHIMSVYYMLVYHMTYTQLVYVYIYICIYIYIRICIL